MKARDFATLANVRHGSDFGDPVDRATRVHWFSGDQQGESGDGRHCESSSRGAPFASSIGAVGPVRPAAPSLRQTQREGTSVPGQIAERSLTARRLGRGARDLHDELNGSTTGRLGDLRAATRSGDRASTDPKISANRPARFESVRFSGCKANRRAVQNPSSVAPSIRSADRRAMPALLSGPGAATRGAEGSAPPERIARSWSTRRRGLSLRGAA